MKKTIIRNSSYGALALFLLLASGCSSDQKGTQPTTDTDVNAEGSAESPTAATSSAGSGGMGGAASTHAIASDTLAADSSNQR
ncbi:hypothetical protein [Rufibacter hautae]|uniref:Uncharacterized protein n=1 Tax=Rufibacter hautae TaxID=2595005 RepID=A0A5B6TU75_9BACT|nr:hypothetical protein [Rufibacter hautae]KAA3440108.1 hypothetical protein FOA19_05425 [Rufibacter hautae]